MPRNDNDSFSLLLKIWLVVSTFTNVVALASLTDGLVAWSDFMQEMIASYATIRDAIWGNLFALFSVDMPAWAHDYFTINSIFAISLLWAIIDGAGSISSSKLNSALRYLKNSVLDFTVGAQVPMSFVRGAKKELADAGVPPTSQQSEQLSEIARPIISIRTISKSVFMAILISASYFTFAFVFPWIIQINDRWDARLASFEFRRLEGRIRKMSWEPVQFDIVLAAFRGCVSQFAAFAAMDDLFHKTLQRSLLKYLISVLVLFLMLVFANQVLTGTF